MVTRYTGEMRDWLEENIPKATYAETAERFTERFGVPLTGKQIRGHAHRHGLNTPYYESGSARWNLEKDEFMREVAPGRSIAEVSDMFFDRFGIRLTKEQVKNRMAKLGVKSGINTGRFQKGHVPPNKGKTLDELDLSQEAREAIRRTQFKPGNTPHNTRPLGSEFADEYGTVYVKLFEGPGLKRFGENARWYPRAVVVYMYHHGHVPDGCRVIHADRNPSNDDISNLVAVDKGDYPMITTRCGNYYDRESLEVCMAAARLIRVRKELGL